MDSSIVEIDNRKDILLLLLLSPGATREKNEPIRGRTRLMKLVFLFYREVAPNLSALKGMDKEKQHQFRPYHFGPFSKDVFDDLQFLENTDLVEEESGGELSMAEISEYRLFYDEALIDRVEIQELTHDYTEPIFALSEKGQRFADQLYKHLKEHERKVIRDFKQRFNSLPLTTLLRYVYTTYPDSATQSKIGDSV